MQHMENINTYVSSGVTIFFCSNGAHYFTKMNFRCCLSRSEIVDAEVTKMFKVANGGLSVDVIPGIYVEEQEF